MKPAKFRLANGAQALVVESHALPLFQFNLTVRAGSVLDPAGKAGLTRLAARMVRMGTRSLSADAVEDRIDAMGAHLSVSVGPAYVSFGGTVVERSLDAFLQLVSTLLLSPAMRNADLGHLKRETIAGLEADFDDDSVLAGRHFRRLALPDHPYGRPTVGTRDSVASVRRQDIIGQYGRLMVGPAIILGLSGPLSAPAARDLFERYFGGFEKRPRAALKVPGAKLPRGRRLVVIDKPERTQTQILIGTSGVRAKDPQYVPLTVANTAFGGLFTSKLTTEVRAKRGWSYGASSGFGHQPQRDLWSMRTFPAAKDAVACIRLQLRLLAGWIERGVSARDLKLAKNYLVNSHAFEFDTAQKRLEQTLDEIVFEQPKGLSDEFPERVAEVTKDQAHAAVQSRISDRDQLIVVVATASDLVAQLERLPGLTSMEVVAFDQGW